MIKTKNGNISVEEFTQIFDFQQNFSIVVHACSPPFVFILSILSVTIFGGSVLGAEG